MAKDAVLLLHKLQYLVCRYRLAPKLLPCFMTNFFQELEGSVLSRSSTYHRNVKLFNDPVWCCVEIIRGYLPLPSKYDNICGCIITHHGEVAVT